MSAASAVRKASRARLLDNWLLALSIVRLARESHDSEPELRAYVQGVIEYAPATLRACLLTAWGM